MSRKFPAASGEECIRALKRGGFEVVRITGGHHHLRKDGHPHLITVPNHRTSLKIKTLKNILISAGLTSEEFRKML